MALQKFSVADAVGILTARGSDDEEELSEDEIIGDFVTEGGESVVLSSEMLSRVPAMTVAPLASEIDSLLLGEEDDDVAEVGGDCGEVVQQIGMIRLGRMTMALLHLCLIGLRHQQTALNLIYQSLGSQLVHPVNLNLPKHPCSGQHTYDTDKHVC